MKKENKRSIYTVMGLLIIRDRWWKGKKNKFKELYAAWRTWELRHKHRNPQFFSVAWKRGWLPIADFDRFLKYAMQ